MSARLIGDVLTDAFVGDHGEGGAFGLLGRLADNQAPLPPSTSPALSSWLNQTRVLPDWVQPARLLRAQRWADEHLPLLVAGLFCASLPSTYAAAKGAWVVHTSGRMRTDIDRRIHETGAFVLDVLRPGSFEPSGRGIWSCCRVRLVHALVRAKLGERSEEVPINQEDMVGTALSFSVVLVDALRKLGVRVSRAQDDDFFHLWRVVGSLLGILPEYLPLNAAAARAEGRRIGERQLGPSKEGRELAEVLFERIADHVAPGRGRHLPRTLSAYLMDANTREALGLRAEPTWLAALPLRGEELQLLGKGAARVARSIGSPLVHRALAQKLAEEA